MPGGVRHARAADDRRGDRDHRIDARRETRQHAASKDEWDRLERIGRQARQKGGQVHGRILTTASKPASVSQGRRNRMKKTLPARFAGVILPILAAAAWFPMVAGAQTRQPAHGSHPDDSTRMAGMADEAMSMPVDNNMTRHMRLTPTRT